MNGADGSYARLGLTFGGRVGVVENDVLRGVETVVGSNRAETMNGNEQLNVFEGRGGDDTINGGRGNDGYIFKGAATRNLGHDTLFDESGIDNVVVDSFANIVDARRVGDDLVVTLPNNNSFTVVDHFAGHQIENLTDTQGHQMTRAASNIGGDGSGIIAGGNAGQLLDGRGGDDFLFGGNGPDRLIGGAGDDRLTGGSGKDTFVFGLAFGRDVVTDFSQPDRIEFDGGAFANFGSVQAAMRQVGNDTVITPDADNSITLLGVNANSLHANNFLFA
jgi:Ca2+-binding RTX toxin-like protein